MIFDLIEEILEERRRRKLKKLVNNMKQDSILNVLRENRIDVIGYIQERAYNWIKERVINDVKHYVDALKHEIKIKASSKNMNFGGRNINDYKNQDILLRINLDITKIALLSYIKNKEREKNE